jgi:MFS family permease
VTVDEIAVEEAPTTPGHPGWWSTRHVDPVVARVLVWTGVALVGMTIVGFAWLMHMVPPPSPADTPEQSLAWVSAHQTSILIGAALVTFFWSFWATWTAPIILYIRRMERAPLLTFASIALVGGGAGVITMIAVAWTVMAFRAENPLIVQAFNDLGFFLFLYTWPGFGILMVVLAVAIFRDVNRKQTFPRWVAYYNLYAALGMLPASFMGLFKTGPLAYNGALAFWVVAIDFFAWMVVMSVVLLRKIREDDAEFRAAVPVS